MAVIDGGSSAAIEMEMLRRHAISLVQQEQDVISRITDYFYRTASTGAFRITPAEGEPYNPDTLGNMFRHVADSYWAFIEGVRLGTIDYVAMRQADVSPGGRELIEHRDRFAEDRQYGIDNFGQIGRALEGMVFDSTSVGAVKELMTTPVESDTRIELADVISHTVHHDAMIRAVLHRIDRSGAYYPEQYGISHATQIRLASEQ